MKFIFLSLCLPIFCLAVTPEKTTPPRHRIRAGAEITIRRYIKESNAFQIALNATPGIGPNYVTPEDLNIAIGDGDKLDEFMKRALRDMGGIYVLRKDVLLLWQVELKIRAKHIKR